jgi:hypothetical protein
VFGLYLWGDVMQHIEEYFHCGDYLKDTFKTYIDDIRSCIAEISWQSDFHGTAVEKKLGTDTKIIDWTH